MGTGVYLRHGYIYSSLAGYVLRKNEGEEVSRGTSAKVDPHLPSLQFRAELLLRDKLVNLLSSLMVSLTPPQFGIKHCDEEFSNACSSCTFVAFCSYL